MVIIPALPGLHTFKGCVERRIARAGRNGVCGVMQADRADAADARAAGLRRAGHLALSPSARRDDHERGTHDQAAFLARQTERGGCVRGGRDGFGGTLLCMDERDGLVIERL
jgi:hypothetical protein